MNIAVIDDVPQDLHIIENALCSYYQERQMDTHIFPFSGSDAFWKDYSVGKYDLIFLDIQMCAMDGLRAAEQIRKLDSKVAIIFLTTLTQYGLEGYQYQATNYIIKPLQYIRLKAEMDKFLARRQTEPDPFLLIVNDTGKYKVFLRDLRYIETFNRNLLCHTEQENILSYKSMKEMESTLQGQGFARCHTSYLVNLFFVKGVKKLEITLVTGETIPISQPKRKEFMERLTEYWGDLL